MTLAELRKKVHGYLENAPGATTRDEDEMLTFINRGLKQFSELTLLIYRTEATLTLAANDKRIDLYESSDVSLPIFWPVNVVISNTPLRNLSNKIGPITYEQMAYLGTHGVSTGTPTRWCRLADHEIMLYPPASGAAANSFVEGYGTHRALSADTDTLEIPDQYGTVAAAFIAAEILAPNGVGATLDRMNAIDARAGRQMGYLVERAKAIMGDVTGEPSAPFRTVASTERE